jgi:hypothetical protein
VQQRQLGQSRSLSLGGQPINNYMLLICSERTKIQFSLTHHLHDAAVNSERLHTCQVPSAHCKQTAHQR